MSNCPNCNIMLIDNAKFCHNCGNELIHSCPICGDDNLVISKLKQNSCRCSQCKSVLYACCKCGRWYNPGHGYCNNPECEGKVLPVVPLHTGRRWDGLGVAPDWQNTTSENEFKSIDINIDSVYAAVSANGIFYVWAGNKIIQINIDNAQIIDENWLLGLNLSPCTILDEADRMTVVGEHICLSCDNGFYWCANGEIPKLLVPGKPICQIIGPMGWAGWVYENGRKKLYVSSIPEVNVQPDPIEIEMNENDLNDNACIQNKQMVTSHNKLFWQGQDCKIREYNYQSEQVSEIRDMAMPVKRLWTFGDKVGCVLEDNNGLVIRQDILNAVRDKRLNMTVLNNIYVSDKYCAVVCNSELVVINLETFNDTRKSLTGRHINGFITTENTHRNIELLLELHKENEQTILLSILLDGLAPEIKWRNGQNINAITMIPTRKYIFIVHENGIIVLKG